MNPNASLHDIPLPSDSQYRRAQRLLKHYRDYSWQLKIAVFQASEMTGIPFTDRTEEFIQIFRQKAAEDINGQQSDSPIPSKRRTILLDFELHLFCFPKT